MENKGILIILLIIIAVLTLSLALTAGYIFFVADKTEKPENAELEEVKEEIKVPSDDELEYYELFSDKTNFNLRSEDDKVHVLQLTAKIKYFKKVKGVKNTAEKIALHDGEIKELIGTYFQSITLEQVSKPEVKEQVKKDLADKINALLNPEGDIDKNIIYAIIFDVWFYQ